MGSRIKEDERAEKAIRSLLKLPENRRCINCNILGPQYVCSTFWTFVCINCSGIHREFTHRVKSVSMAKFTAEEVNALRAGGNERARQIYFKEWNPRRDTYPDGSNMLKLRAFIKSVYVDKRYCGESNDKISPQTAVIEDYKESKKTGAKFFGSRSLHTMDTSEIEKVSAAGRNGNKSLMFYFDDKKQKQPVTPNPKSRGLPKSPIRFEIVDDRFRDDGSVKRYDRDSRGSSKSLDLSNKKDMPSFPIVRHTRELSGDNAAPHLRVGKAETVEKKKEPVTNQMTASSDKMENPRSLMDDDLASEAPDETISQHSTEITASLKTTQDPAPNSLEALLFGLSVPETNNSELWSKSGVSSAVSVDNNSADNVTALVKSPTSVQAQSSHDGSSVLPGASDNLNTKETPTTSVAANNQDMFSSCGNALQTHLESTSPKEPSDTSMELSTQCISNSAHGVESEHHHQDETKSNIRKALPEDLFTGGFSFASPHVHGQQYGMGYGMQYYQHPVAMGAFTYKSKSANPFDISDDTAPNQTPQFPSMTCVPAPIGYSDCSSPAADSTGMMNSQSTFYTPALSQNSVASNLFPGSFIDQQSQMNMSPSFRRQETTEGNNFNAAQAFHQANNGYPYATPNAYISRGNPFE